VTVWQSVRIILVGTSRRALFRWGEIIVLDHVTYGLGLQRPFNDAPHHALSNTSHAYVYLFLIVWICSTIYDGWLGANAVADATDPDGEDGL
jgi:hypothetical protein